MPRNQVKLGGWAYPFEPWVVETWRRRSEEIGGPAIAAAFRKNLTDPEGARLSAGLPAYSPRVSEPRPGRNPG